MADPTRRRGSISAVVLLYRNWPGVRATIDSLLAQGTAIAEIVVVDQEGTAGTPAPIESAYPSVRVIRPTVNGGYGAGMNAGVAATDPSSDAVLLVTHDCLVGAGCVERLADLLWSADDIGAAGPVLCWRSRPGAVFSGGGRIDADGLPSHRWADDRLVTHLRRPTADPEWLDGACILVRSAAFDRIGGFDPAYFLYFEDADFGLRLRRAGWRVAVAPGALAWQEPADSLPVALWVRNRLRFLRTHGTAAQRRAELRRAAAAAGRGVRFGARRLDRGPLRRAAARLYGVLAAYLPIDPVRLARRGSRHQRPGGRWDATVRPPIHPLTRPEEQSVTNTAQRILALIDLTNLDPQATAADIERLCADALTVHGPVAAVCVWPAFVAQCVHLLGASGVRVATVVNFPDGGEDVEAVVAATRQAVADGADEIDVVIPYRALLRGDSVAVIELVDAVVNAAGSAHVKAILETGELPDQPTVARATELAIAAGAAFVKTSTGTTPVSATPEAAHTMLEVIHGAGRPVGLKPSGGIRTVGQAAVYLDLADQVMGASWATPDTFRIGASSLLRDVLAHLGEPGDETPTAPR